MADIYWDQTFEAVFNGILACIRSEDTPVAVCGVLALEPLMSYDLVLNAMKPHAPQIMSDILKLNNEIDSDILSQVSEQLVESFAVELTPFAVELCVSLRDSFMRYMSELPKDTPNYDTIDFDDDGQMDETGDKTMAALGVLKSIQTLVRSVASTGEVLGQLENELMPLILYILDNNVFDFFEEALEVVDACTLATRQISPNMWIVFNSIYKAFKHFGNDCIEDIVPSLENYISFGQQTFVADENVQFAMMDIIQSVLTSNNLGDSERIGAIKLAESIMLNCRGCADKVSRRRGERAPVLAAFALTFPPVH